MKTLGLALLGLCYVILIVHVVRSLWGYYHPPRPRADWRDVSYMGKQARILHKDRKRSLIVMKESGARAWVQNKNLKTAK